MEPAPLFIPTKEIEVACPGCGEIHLHHTGIKIFDRADDDLKVKTINFVQNEWPVIQKEDNNQSGNPSPRRDGVSISFICEHCPGDDFILDIYQHKGTTYIKWRE